MLKMVKHTLKIMRCEQRKIFKVILINIMLEKVNLVNIFHIRVSINFSYIARCCLE